VGSVRVRGDGQAEAGGFFDDDPQLVLAKLGLPHGW